VLCGETATTNNRLIAEVELRARMIEAALRSVCGIIDVQTYALL
jgi:hypothetical protein